MRMRGSSRAWYAFLVRDDSYGGERIDVGRELEDVPRWGWSRLRHRLGSALGGDVPHSGWRVGRGCCPLPHPPVVSAEGVGALLVEAGGVDAEDERLAAAAEAVLLDLEEALSVRLGVLLFVDEEVTVGVDGVLDRLLPGEVAGLGDLADDEGDAVGLLAPVGDHLDGADLGHRVGAAVLVLPVVQGLERVDDEEDLLLGVRLAEAVGVGEELGDEDVLSGDEAVLHAEALRDLADLEERLLTRVEEADVALGRDGVGELEAHGGLTGAGRTGEHHRGGGRHALAADGLIEPLETGLHRALELGRNLEVEDVGAALPGLETDVQVHVRHLLVPCWGCLTFLIYHVPVELCTGSCRFERDRPCRWDGLRPGGLRWSRTRGRCLGPGMPWASRWAADRGRHTRSFGTP